MKKLFYSAFLMLFACGLQAQLRIGAGATLTPDFGLTVKAQKDLAESIDLDLMATYYFIENTEFTFLGVTTKTSTSLIEIDLNGHYNFVADESYDVYGLAGIGIFLLSSKTEQTGLPDTDFSDTGFGINIGAGGVYHLSSLDIWAEASYHIGDYDDFFFRAGVMIPFGG